MCGARMRSWTRPMRRPIAREMDSLASEASTGSAAAFGTLASTSTTRFRVADSIDQAGLRDTRIEFRLPSTE